MQRMLPNYFNLTRKALHMALPLARFHQKMVEVNGIEPMTSCLQSRRSPN